MIGLLIVLGVLDLFLVLRFVQPELVYTLREQLGPVMSNRLLLDSMAHKNANPDRSRKLQRLFWQDHRGESRIYSGPMVRTRLMRNRARLRSIESTRDTGFEFPEARDVAACLEELSDLLHGVSRRLKPTGIYVHDVVDAPRLLRAIYDWQQASSDVRQWEASPRPPTDDPNHLWTDVDREAAAPETESLPEHSRPMDPRSGELDMESYFEKNPMPIEQAIELVYAAIYALSYRIEQ